MRRFTLILFALTAIPSAAAQVQFVLRPPAETLFQGQASAVTFVVKNLSTKDFHFTRQNCHPELKILRVPDGQNMLPDTATACIDSTPPVETVKARTRREITLAVPPLPSGDYVLSTNFMPGTFSQVTPSAQTRLHVGPGPLMAALALKAPAKAAQKLPLEVIFVNIGQVSNAPRVCPLGIMIRNMNGRIVYDNQAERLACKTGGPTKSVAAGKTLHYALNLPVILPIGSYTAILWGTYNDSLRFEVE